MNEIINLSKKENILNLLSPDDGKESFSPQDIYELGYKNSKEIVFDLKKLLYSCFSEYIEDKVNTSLNNSLLSHKRNILFKESKYNVIYNSYNDIIEVSRSLDNNDLEYYNQEEFSNILNNLFGKIDDLEIDKEDMKFKIHKVGLPRISKFQRLFMKLDKLQFYLCKVLKGEFSSEMKEYRSHRSGTLTSLHLDYEEREIQCYKSIRNIFKEYYEIITNLSNYLDSSKFIKRVSLLEGRLSKIGNRLEEEYIKYKETKRKEVS